MNKLLEKKCMLIMILFFTLLKGYSMGQILPEQRASVKKDQIIKQKDGLYQAIVPDTYLYMIEEGAGPKSLMLSYEGMLGYAKGSYYIIPLKKDPMTMKTNLDSVLTIIKNSLTEQIPGQVEVLNEEKILWKELSVIYHEWYVPGDIYKNGNVTQVRINNFGYAGIMVEKNNIYYWISHCDPIDEEKVINKKIKLKNETRELFKIFINGITLN